MYMCALPLSALENMREQRRTSPLTSSHASVLTSVDTMGVAVLLTSCIVQNTNDDGMSKFALAAPAGKNKEKVHIASCWTQIMKVAAYIYTHTRGQYPCLATDFKKNYSISMSGRQSLSCSAMRSELSVPRSSIQWTSKRIDDRQL